LQAGTELACHQLIDACLHCRRLVPALLMEVEVELLLVLLEALHLAADVTETNVAKRIHNGKYNSRLVCKYVDTPLLTHAAYH